MMKWAFFWGGALFVLEGLIGLHRNVQLQFFSIIASHPGVMDLIE